ncbi:MAG: FecR domain-containing protein [Chitinophaga sp.]|uniref:FecR family protein n=1 Tax=Chitinophaga sp. TaxID=1869181 RepID=UPI0025BED1D5|nr:FecR domain-containing protein [Chitinophaga sp.]MBV8254084.1 FecR domain-containing protein [Chitinophaga sp.]
MKENQDLLNAIERYLRGEATAEERALVNQWYNSFDDAEIMVPPVPGFSENEIFSRIQMQLDKVVETPVHRRKVYPVWMKRTAVAASIAVLLGVGFSLMPKRKLTMHASVTVSPQPTTVMPGSNKAVLFLDDGTPVALDDSIHPAINGAQVQGESLVYDQAGNTTNTVRYNTLRTPQGGQFTVVLPDGSKVWLNAASSLKYPTSFTDDHRTVELTGEAYFEIAADKNKPFFVAVNKMKVEVLGTSFNIMAYPDEHATTTTLVTGAVNVTNANATKRLLPGQQATLNHQEQFTVSDADVSAAIAWKEGKFEFNGEDIAVALRQLTRWYDLQLQIEEGAAEGHVSAAFPRTTSLENVLKMLELSGIHCQINDRQLIVSKN